jgi:hypothetical protein
MENCGMLLNPIVEFVKFPQYFGAKKGLKVSLYA